MNKYAVISLAFIGLGLLGSILMDCGFYNCVTPYAMMAVGGMGCIFGPLFAAIYDCSKNGGR